MTNASVKGSRPGPLVRVLRGLLATVGLVVALGVNVGASCSSGGGGGGSSVDIPIEYMPREAEATPIVRIPNSSQVKIMIVPAVDKRDEPDKRVIGRNIEKSNNPLPVVATNGLPADLFTRALRKQVRDAGLDVTDDMAVATRTLDSEIVVMEVTEGNRYRGEVRVNFKLVDQTGKELWSDSFSGEGSNHGRSKSAENYNQTLSDAIKNATSKMLLDRGFKDALTAEPR